MTDDVNPPGEAATLRQAQTALTEQRILAAATELFLADGYVATTLEAVARRARVAARTVYVRFGTKAALFKRVIDVAVVGDHEPVDVLGRDWMIEAMSAPGLAGRIAAGAAAGHRLDLAHRHRHRHCLGGDLPAGQPHARLGPGHLPGLGRDHLDPAAD